MSLPIRSNTVSAASPPTNVKTPDMDSKKLSLSVPPSTFSTDSTPINVKTPDMDSLELGLSVPSPTVSAASSPIVDTTPNMDSLESSLYLPSINTVSASPTNVEEEGVNNSDPNKVSDYFKTFPRGFKFLPTDEDLIFYLSKKLNNEALPPNLIVELDLYQYNPKYLAATYMDYGEKQWYFFTPRERKYQNGSRPKRSAADGYWKATGTDKLIENDARPVGYKRTLVFHKGKPKSGGDKTNWCMHEFTVHEPPQMKRKSTDMKLDEWVLCRIYKGKRDVKSNQTKKSIEEKEKAEDEDGPNE